MATTKWEADPLTSEVLFNVSQFVFEDLTGYLRKFYLEIATEDDDFTKFYGVVFNADLSCLDTNDEQRDNLLKSPSFLNVEKFRSLKFVGKKFGSLNNKDHLTGSLTLKDITKSLDITIEFNGKTVAPDGVTKIDFSLFGEISREAYGLSCDSISQLAGIVLGDKVKFNAEIQLNKIF